MPILLYCVSNRTPSAFHSLTGAAGLQVMCVEAHKLTAFISSASEPVWLQQPLRIVAVDFHRVCNEIFKSVAIIPFRFPTTFETNEELNKHMERRSDEYSSWLEKFRDAVQMDLQISSTDLGTSAESGKAYLKGRKNLANAAEHVSCELKQKLSSVVTNWRERPFRDGLRTFALVRREVVPKFQEAMRTISLAPGIKVRVSGPWPVSEFIEQR
jgi:Gas vesicle synthesis protein GvpL/GvpF